MKQKTVLVIEDNPMNMKLVKAILETENFRILAAEDAETGLPMVREQKPDLILMDIQLPKMNGYEATRLIKADPNLVHIPVIALTSYAMKDDREKALIAGCDEYISKPFKPKEVLEKIRSYLNAG